MTDKVAFRASGESRAKVEEVHFYPGSEILVYVVDGKVKLVAQAVGGPATKQARKPTESMAAEPTDPGEFVIDRMEAYKTNTWQLSKIKWGTRIRANMIHTNRLEYQGPDGNWLPLRVMISDGPDSKKRLLTVMDVVRVNYARYDSYTLPDTWMLNDFGPVAVRYYRDRNRNRRLDVGERLEGRMIHTTPQNEAHSTMTNGDPTKVVLIESHGCIHVRPVDRQKFVDARAFRQGMPLIIHRYDELFDPDKHK
jgi:hypothetical protein